jgi:uncharacterized protein YjbJ (UPF0337 family)
MAGTHGETDREEIEMNWDLIEVNWKQFKGSIKAQWSKLNDYQIYVIAGKRDQLAVKIQETYWISRDEVERQLADWQDRQKGINRPVAMTPQEHETPPSKHRSSATA